MSKTIGPAAPHAGSLKRSLLTCGGTLALLSACAFTAPAMAQDTKPAASGAADTQTVVVRGIRKGIQDAITAKKKSSQIVEAVSAEDIGKLPDASIAESIARLPGIAAQRTNGRAQTLSVRGLGPDFTLTTLNGREQVSTNDNRSVEFDQYPSELISQVLVYKTPNAGMVAQGLAGTADLQTVRPLAFGKRAFAIGVRGEKNSETAAIGGMKNTGNRVSMMYIDQFANKTIGLAIGYAHTDSPYQTLKKESWGFPTCSACKPADQTLLITGGEKDAVDSSNLTRDGYMGVLEFKPTDHLHVTLDAYHSDFTELQRIARLEYPLAWGANSLQPGYSTGNGYVTSGTFTNVKTVVENYINQRKAKLDSFGANVTYDLNDQWSLLGDASYGKVTRNDFLIESTAGTGASGSGATDTINFTQNADGTTNLRGTVDYSDFGKIFLTDPGGWGGPIANRAGYAKIPHITDEIKAIKAAATRKLNGGFLADISFGVNHTEHTKDKKGVEGFLGLKGASATAVVPNAYRTGTTDAQFLGNSSGMISYDALGLYQSGFFNFQEDTTTASLQKTWNVKEKIDYVYIRGDIDTTFLGKPLSGNFGVMSEHADQQATSLYTTGAGDFAPVTGGTSYTDLLPSVSLNWQVASDTTLRFGAGTTLARPRMDDMAAGSSYSVANDSSVAGSINGQAVYWSGGGGNPKLKPWKSNNFDLSLEKYFGRKGYLSAALFYKDLKTFIFNDTTIHDFTGVPLPSYCKNSSNVNICTKADANRIGLSSQMNNGKGGHIEGLELSASVPGEMVAPWLDGFGLIWSGALNQSQVNIHGSNYDVPGLSKQVINTTVYYEKHGFSARISNRYRGDFLGEVPNYTNTLEYDWVHSESIIDAQLGYTWDAGPLKGFSLSLSGQNLTNEPFTLYQGKGQRNHTIRSEKYGSTYLFGVSYRY